VLSGKGYCRQRAWTLKGAQFMAKSEGATLRLVHHLSSSGGTIISKCLAVMPRTVLLSEIHPTTVHRVEFFPIDPLGQLIWNYPRLAPPIDVLYEQFRSRLKPVVDVCASLDKILILRDHSHSDYLTNQEPAGRLVAALRPAFELRRAATIRDPIDAWLSMTASGFDYHVKGFDDYCGRVVKFVMDHQDIRFWRYEDFIARPATVMAELCRHLEVPFDAQFVSRYNNVTLTGDSGRKPATITTLPRRQMPDGFLTTVRSSRGYGIIAERFGYDTYAGV
jgi:hypothetical protein